MGWWVGDDRRLEVWESGKVLVSVGGGEESLVKVLSMGCSSPMGE